MKSILFLLSLISVSCVTTKTTETKPDGTTVVTETTVSDPILIGKAIDSGLTAAQILAQKKQAEVDQNSTK